MRPYLFLYPSTRENAEQIEAEQSVLPAQPAAAAELVNEIARAGGHDVFVFWDRSLGPVPADVVQRFASSLDDAWHPGTRLTGVDEPDLLSFALPLWIYRPAPDAELAGAINWRLDLRALLIRSRVIASVGGLDGQFDTLAGMGRELGLRLIKRGAICRQHPEIIASAGAPSEISLADRYRLLRSQAGSKWTSYSLLRRLARRPVDAPKELAAWRATQSHQPPERATIGALQRSVDAVELPVRPTVSVVLPTFGRYRYVAEVLDDLRAQTIQVSQILIADGNPPPDRQPEVYERYRDLPIEVLWHEEQGICSGRNACLRRATGDYIWFVDDDSRFDATNLESHLRVLAGYGADVSVGPAYMPSRPQLTPDQSEVTCSFMDCGTTLVRRELLTRVGGFDMQFNRYLMGEDNDLGIRFIRAGGLMVNNPLAKRFHYLAPVGGSRSKGSVHRFRRWSLLPRPVQSIYYLARRHFEPGVQWDAMLQASVTVGTKRHGPKPATRMWRASNLVAECLALPLTAVRFIRSARVGREMVASGPQIPLLDADG